MQSYRVTISPTAEDDLESIYGHVLEASGRARAERLLAESTAACRQLRIFPLRGQRRDDLRSGVRVISHRRRASIAFVVVADEVIILHVAWRGRDISSDF